MMWISKKDFDALIGKYKSEIEQSARAKFYKDIEELKQEINTLKAKMPYEEYLKSLPVNNLKYVARDIHGISERMLNECDNKADLIKEILYAKRDLEKIKPL